VAVNTTEQLPNNGRCIVAYFPVVAYERVYMPQYQKYQVYTNNAVLYFTSFICVLDSINNTNYRKKNAKNKNISEHYMTGYERKNYKIENNKITGTKKKYN
jgi:hypothetical protein